MSNSILRMENVTMQFGGVVAVNDLSLEVNEGEIVALIGPNGAGKTTAFNCITGVYEPTNGQIFYRDEILVANHPQGKMRKLYAGENAGKYTKVVSRTPDEITRMGIARTFQNIRLFSSLTALENVLISQHLHIKSSMFSATLLSQLPFIKSRTRREEEHMYQRARELLAEVGLEQYENEVSGSLPYGIQRRLEIARALATNPTLLLLDEPAAGMNPQETRALTEFIVEIKNRYKLSVFMIEHHMDVVMSISDRIYVLDFGKLIAHGTREEVQNNQRVIDAYLGVAEDA